MSGNQILRLPPQLSQLQHLVVFRAARNELTMVEDMSHLSSLRQLRHLTADDNPFCNSSSDNRILQMLPQLHTFNRQEVGVVDSLTAKQDHSESDGLGEAEVPQAGLFASPPGRLSASGVVGSMDGYKPDSNVDISTTLAPWQQQLKASSRQMDQQLQQVASMYMSELLLLTNCGQLDQHMYCGCNVCTVVSYGCKMGSVVDMK